MVVAKYQPPAEVPEIEGLSRESQERLRAWLKAQFTQLAEDLGGITHNDASTVVLTATRIDVPAGAKRRVSTPAAGTVVVLEAPSPSNAGAEVVIFLENPRGSLTIASSPGLDEGGRVFLPLINGARQATYKVAGVITLRSNGSTAWSSPAELPAESPASPQAVALAAAPVDAEYVLGSASAALTAARVATASAEIKPDRSSVGLISWALNAASVTLAKLANLPGLSVLGRAATSTGVMAAITATAGKQYLRSNAAFTSLEWGSPASTSIVDNAGSFERAAATGDVTAGQNSNAFSFRAFAANTVLANATAGSAVPSDLAVNANGVLGRTSGNLQSIDSSAQTAFIRGSGNVFWATAAINQVLCRGASGDLGFQALPLTAIAQIGTDTFLGNITGGLSTPVATSLGSLASTSIGYNSVAHQFQTNPVSGVVAIAANGVTSAFTAAPALSVLANAANASTVPTYFSGSAALQYLRRNAANNALEWGALPGLPTIQPGSFIGLQIDAGGAATAIEITGAEAGENIRFGTPQNDTTSTGTVNAYSLNANTTQVVFGAGAGTITLNGIAGGSEGREVAFIFDDGYTGNLSVVSLSAAASAGNKIGTGNDITTTFVKGDSFTVRYENSIWRITALARRVPQYQINAGTAAPADTCNISSGTGIAVTGAVTSASATYTVGLATAASDTVKANVTGGSAVPSDVALSSLAGSGLGFSSHKFVLSPAAQSNLDAGTNSTLPLVSSLLGFRSALTASHAIKTLTNSTAWNDGADPYTIAAGTLVAGSCYLLIGFWTVTRGTTATASTFGGRLTVAGAQVTGTIGAAVFTTTSASGGGLAIGMINVDSTGTSGKATAGMFMAGTGIGLQGSGVAAAEFTINTTVSNVINASIGFGTAVANLSCSWTNLAIVRLK